MLSITKTASWISLPSYTPHPDRLFLMSTNGSYMTATFFLDIAEKNLLKDKESILLTPFDSWNSASAKIPAVLYFIHFVWVLTRNEYWIQLFFFAGFEDRTEESCFGRALAILWFAEPNCFRIPAHRKEAGIGIYNADRKQSSGFWELCGLCRL